MNTKISARDFFLQIGAIASFYVGVVALLMLLFRVIGVAYPAMRTSVYYGASSISFQVATLIVAFPLFLFLSWKTQKTHEKEPELKNAGLRKWLAYITLFIAGVIVAGDLVTVIYMYLDGRELTTGFLLKVLTLLVVAVGVFAYYLRDIKNIITPKERNIWRLAATALVLGSILLGFSVMGSPASQREIRADQDKLSDLQSIQWRLGDYYQQKGELPESLDVFDEPFSSYMVPSDRETGEEYAYEKTGELSFELCANFHRETPRAGEPSLARDIYHGHGGMNESWDHSAGEHCFERTIDPELYPVRNR